MATTNTAQRLITFAMVDAGLIAEGVTPSASLLSTYMDRLNDLLNLWQTGGLKVWLQFAQPVTLVASQATYTLMPGGDVDMTRPTRVILGQYVTSDNISRPLIPISWEEYNRLSSKVTPGTVNSYFVDKKPSVLNVNFWMPPDASAASGSVILTLQQQISTFATVSDLMDLPPEWFMALRWGLADEICGGQPQSIMDRCAAKALMYKAALEDWDTEDADTTFSAGQSGRAGSFT